jgi:hypothetical protein
LATKKDRTNAVFKIRSIFIIKILYKNPRHVRGFLYLRVPRAVSEMRMTGTHKTPPRGFRPKRLRFVSRAKRQRERKLRMQIVQTKPEAIVTIASGAVCAKKKESLK